MTYGVPQTILLGDTSLTITANSTITSNRQTPTNVAMYLEREGWRRSGDYWMPQNWDNNISGNNMTWEQALIYTGFTKLNLL